MLWKAHAEALDPDAGALCLRGLSLGGVQALESPGVLRLSEDLESIAGASPSPILPGFRVR